MAPTSPFSSPSSQFSANYDQPCLESIRVLVISINQHMLELITNGESWTSLKLKCSSMLNVQSREFFEFSDLAVLSNLHWGIEGIEAAIVADSAEERASQLRDSEKKLQLPALLDEQGATAGILNAYLVSFSYFYLSVVKCLQFDQSQAALHFLQAVSVSPNLCRTELAPKLCQHLFASIDETSSQETDNRKSSESMRQTVRRYKHWLIYQHVVLCGETAQWQRGQGHIISPANASDSSMFEVSSNNMESSISTEHRYDKKAYSNYEKVHPLDPQVYTIDGMTNDPLTSKKAQENKIDIKAIKSLEQTSEARLQKELINRKPKRKCLRDMLMEPQSDMPSPRSFYIDFYDKFHSEESIKHLESLVNTGTNIADDSKIVFSSQNLDVTYHTCGQECTTTIYHLAPENSFFGKGNDRNISSFSPCRFLRSTSDITSYTLDNREKNTNCIFHSEASQRYSGSHNQELFEQIIPKCWTNSSTQTRCNDLCSAIDEPKLHFPNRSVKFGQDYTVEVATIYKMLNNKTGAKYVMLKNEILEQLVATVSTTKEETAIRASISMLVTIISLNKTVLEDIKKKGLQLSDLAKALKQNVHEAAVLIYLVKPSPKEIKALGLLPALVDVVCSSTSFKVRLESFLPTPPAASLMIIEVLVTSFDNTVNDIQLATISSPHVLSGLLDVARNHGLKEFISLATILVKCMLFDGQCRKYVSQVIPVAPFICLIQSNEKHAKLIGLEFFHQVLCIPRSSAVSILQQIYKEGSINIMNTLMLSIQQLESEYQLLAAGLLLQLDSLGNPFGTSLFKEKALQILLESIASEDSSNRGLLSAFILSNIGGTFAWTGEPYTTAWLVKKAGLTSTHHQNMIRSIDWSDQCLQDSGIDSWSSKIARGIIEVGKPVFISLAKALKSKTKNVSSNALTTIAWLGCEIARSSNTLQCSAIEVLLSELEKFLHPGVELEERLLACLSIYNYASGKGMKKLIHFSEGVRESLRRFSSVTWIANELYLVTDYFHPNKSRISCVHTQTLEINCKHEGAVTALIFYKGLLCSGYSDGSIKIWDINKQSATLLWDLKKHNKAVTCFALHEQKDSLLSGSSDKTIRVWKMIQRKLECIEVIAMKEPIQQLGTHGKRIFLVTQGNQMKVLDSSRKASCFCKSKKVKCIKVLHGRIYMGCIDSSIQELSITSNNEQEIKAPEKSWRMQTKPINSIIMYKDWIYCASSVVHGATIKEWRRRCQPQMTMIPEKGANVLAMEVTEDFIYLNCSSSSNNLQIWLRGTQQKVGRITAGSRITSLLTANDIIVCGTEAGLIKGWIPL